MANLILEFAIEGDKVLLRKLEGVAADFKDWTPEFRQVGYMLQKTFRDNFAHEGSMLGKPWAPLSPRTLQEKRRHGYPDDILVRTGKMRDSFVSHAEATFVEIENTVPYFVYHQSNKPRKKLPRRIMMTLDEKRRQTIVKIFQTAAKNKLQARGL